MAGVQEEQEAEDNEDDAGLDIRSNDEDQRQLETKMDAKYGRRNGCYDLRSRKERDYSHLFATKCTQFNINEKPSKNYADQATNHTTGGAEYGPSWGSTK